MNDDIYAPPQSEPAISTSGLASRGSRLGASLLDSLIMSVFTLPVMYFTGGFDSITNPDIQPSLLYNIGFGLFGLVVFTIINLKLLTKNGQTLGKKIVGIKIVNLEGELPTWKQNLFRRYAVFFLPGQVPVVGQIFAVINILFIFRKNQKCVHDLAANTKVIKPD